VPDYDTVIVGAGFSGIGTAIKLDKSGLSDYLVIEAGDGPGGTWYWNKYPGIAVDAVVRTSFPSSRARSGRAPTRLGTN
jgi:cation diffusion facilitator CzcD-associated flavoprotein CzcO